MTKKKIILNKKKSNKRKIHILEKFIDKKFKNENVIILNETNKNDINFDNKETNNFFQKIVKILNVAFEREREYHISKGSYYPGYKHDINTIKNNIYRSNYETYILTTKKMRPISFLYIEKNEDDYDKVWTVCADKKFRGRGLTSKLMDFTIEKQLKNSNPNRNNMLLEVFNDEIINRHNKDVKQEHIMGLFNSKGFREINPNKLPQHSFNNLLSKVGETKIMIFN
jgi:hypothetical protein